ncbi:MAG TPA: RNA polymerase sigma factor [Pyrinomonadaceae bacterium]|jgi:RNA polymerase sigma-70 factor (ECF subfamily)
MTEITDSLPFAGAAAFNDTVSEPRSSRSGDYELAQKAAAGDMPAFEEIYWKYHRRVFGICFHMCRNASESEDLTQQIFIQLFQKIGSFRGEAAFSTWLHRLSVNWILMQFRKKRARREEVSEDGILPEPVSNQGNNFSGKQIFDRLLLEEVIGKLPKGYKQMLILHDVCGYEHDEIARMLNCSSGTSKSQLFKARQKLRKILSSEANVGKLQGAA